MYRIYTYRLSKITVCYVLLTAWSVYGFVSLLDNTMQWGCIVDDHLFFFTNTTYSLLSISMLLGSFYYRETSLGKWLALLETAFWIYKLFIIKGGYVVGIGGSVSEEVLIFDAIGLFFRLTLLRLLFKLPVHWMLTILLAVLLMMLKVEYFH